MRQHSVTFYSPGTFVSESTTKPIGEWETEQAMKMAGDVSERYGAKPFGFRFHTHIVSGDVPDGEGGALKVQPREVAASSMHHINATVETFDDVEARGDEKESIMRSNMRCNGYPLVAITTNSFKSTQPFGVDDVLVNADGVITGKGSDEEYSTYRDRKMAEWAAMNQASA